MRIGIIGGGAAGMMAALSASDKSNHEITILEQRDIVGKKITATGNGRCNYTNLNWSRDCYRGDIYLLNSAMELLPVDKLVAYLKGLGIYPKNREGYLYPYSDSAASFRKVMEMAVIDRGVHIFTNIKIETFGKEEDFSFVTNQGEFHFDKVIFATGLLAAPKLGSDGSAFPFIEGVGHHFTPIYPALCGFLAEGLPFDAVAGVRVCAKASLFIEDEKIMEDTGEIQLTEYGLSGIPVFQLSSFAVKALGTNKTVEIQLDLFPEISERDLFDMLKSRLLSLPGNRKLIDAFHGLLNPKLAAGICSVHWISQKTKINLVDDELMKKLVSTMKALSISLIEARGFEQAQVCAGGIVSEEIDADTLESKLVPGLFFAGELLNLDGKCGGYNLQWAFSSGYLAGRKASE